MGTNKLTPWRFVIGFGVVSMLADLVYESARAIPGPYLATLGASAALVGIVTGAGEAIALVLRLLSGPLSDRTRHYWPITIVGLPDDGDRGARCWRSPRPSLKPLSR